MSLGGGDDRSLGARRLSLVARRGLAHHRLSLVNDCVVEGTRPGTGLEGGNGDWIAPRGIVVPLVPLLGPCGQLWRSAACVLLRGLCVVWCGRSALCDGGVPRRREPGIRASCYRVGSVSREGIWTAESSHGRPACRCWLTVRAPRVEGKTQRGQSDMSWVGGARWVMGAGDDPRPQAQIPHEGGGGQGARAPIPGCEWSVCVRVCDAALRCCSGRECACGPVCVLCAAERVRGVRRWQALLGLGLAKQNRIFALAEE